MKNIIPPHIILHKSKEVIFYISKNCNETINIDLWINELKLFDYEGMVINSKCIFNRLKNDVYLSDN